MGGGVDFSANARVCAWAAERFNLAREVTVPRALVWTLYRQA
jgi:hypothetical protein